MRAYALPAALLLTVTAATPATAKPRDPAVATVATPAAAKPPAASRMPAPPSSVLSDQRAPSHKTFGTGRLTFAKKRKAGAAPAVGDVRQWLGLDDVSGQLYRKNYTLRAAGEHIEVWVAEDLAFPAGDCRPAGSTEVTDGQIRALVREFDGTIYPRETAAFSTPPDRDGSDPLLDGDFTGAGEKTVTLVDNVRDDNYYDFPDAPTYVAGFFSAQINELVDRNVMTIDAYDWRHRTGANPPDEPTDGLCSSRPARPRMYEGTFAHEWQHLLQSYTDPDEELWVNEGLSDYAQTLVGYVDGSTGVHHPGPDPHLMCFQGFATVRTRHNANPRECGGPQGSLNLWEEGASSDVLADYGHAYQFMLYLRDRFGPDVLSRLHRDGTRKGLPGVAAALGAEAGLEEVLHDFHTMNLVDKLVGDPGGTIEGVRREQVTAASLRATVNLDNPAAYDRAGAAPNGADYVRLRNAAGRYLSGPDLQSVRFTGAATLPPHPLGWSSVDGALFSGRGDSRDAAAVLAVDIPAGQPALTFRTKHGAEEGYDYGYVIVSTDGGRTYDFLAGDRTATGPLGPGLTGEVAEFETRTYDLSPYAGRSALIGFRYVTDKAVDRGGWYVDDIAVAGRIVSDGSGVTGLRTPTQIVPQTVHGWHVRLVGLDAAKRRAKQVPVADFAALRGYPKIVAIVAHDEPTEQIDQYAPYVLTVNGFVQPGGGRTESPTGIGDRDS